MVLESQGRLGSRSLRLIQGSFLEYKSPQPAAPRHVLFVSRSAKTCSSPHARGRCAYAGCVSCSTIEHHHLRRIFVFNGLPQPYPCTMQHRF